MGMYVLIRSWYPDLHTTWSPKSVAAYKGSLDQKIQYLGTIRFSDCPVVYIYLSIQTPQFAPHSFVLALTSRRAFIRIPR